MIVALLIRWVVYAVAFVVTAWLLDGMSVSGGFGTYLWLALLFGIIDAVVGTILKLLTLPLMVITLGLFALVINAFLLQILDWISSHFTIDHFFWTAIWGAVILAIVSVVLEFFVSVTFGRRHRAAVA